MPTAKELLNAGQLSAAIDQLTQEVRAKPGDSTLRIFLFELLCFTGEFVRAEKQLDAVSQENVQAELGVQVYRNNIKAERDRSRLFSEGLQPHFLTEPPAYVDLHLNAINQLRGGNPAECRTLLDRAEEERPALPGKLNGRPFSDFRDYNDLTAPVLEVIVNNKYTWIPLEQLKKMEIAPPKQLRDLIWASARIEAANGTVGEVFLPALYAGSCEHSNDQVKLGRMTDWKQVSDELYLGAGLRLYLVDDEDKTIFELKSIEFDLVRSEASSAPS